MSNTPTPKASFPKSIPYIIGNEAAERFSFYGMKAILTTFLASHFFSHLGAEVARSKANEQTHFFISMAYFMPLLGGLLADWYWGKYKTILWISIIYCLGHACLAIFENDLQGFTFGLLLIAIGAGGIKPNVSANVGDQFDKSNEHLIEKAFSAFYFSINFGAFFSQMLIPKIMVNYGPALAFGVPGILMAIATFVFWLGRKKYRKVPPSGYKRENFVMINFHALKCALSGRKDKTVWDQVGESFSQKSIDGVKAVYRVLAVFAFIPLFWALYDQNGSEWVLQAKSLDLNFLGHEWLAEQIQSVNAILILVFIPLFSFVIYPTVEKLGIRVTPLRKIGAGFVLTALSFVIIALLQESIDAGGKPNVGWQVLAYVVLTAGEILISITGLEYAYTQAPPSMKSTIMSFWLLTVSLGNILVSLIHGSISEGSGWFAENLHGAGFYWFCIALISVNMVLFFFISPRIIEKKYLAEE